MNLKNLALNSLRGSSASRSAVRLRSETAEISLRSPYRWHSDDSVALDRLLQAGDLDSYGPTVRAWESDFTTWLGWGHAIATSSGTSALTVALLALGLAPGDLVAVPSLTFCATAQAVRCAGGTPLFVDVDPETLVMTAATLGPALRFARLRAVIAVHLFGNMADVASLRVLCDKRAVLLVEDAAQSLGSTLVLGTADQARRVAAFSFNSGKQLPLGEGGMLVYGDAVSRDNARPKRHCGLKEVRGDWIATSEAGNYLMSALAAALGRSLLHRVNDWNATRCALKHRLDTLVRSTTGFRPQETTRSCTQVPHRWAFVCPSARHACRVLRISSELGVGIRRLYRPVHHHPAFRHAPCAAPLPNTDMLAACLLCLELDLKEPDVQFDAVEQVMRVAKT